jgi:hypothetical protein
MAHRITTLKEDAVTADGLVANPRVVPLADVLFIDCDLGDPDGPL